MKRRLVIVSAMVAVLGASTVWRVWIYPGPPSATPAEDFGIRIGSHYQELALLQKQPNRAVRRGQLCTKISELFARLDSAHIVFPYLYDAPDFRQYEARVALRVREQFGDYRRLC